MIPLEAVARRAVHRAGVARHTESYSHLCLPSTASVCQSDSPSSAARWSPAAAAPTFAPSSRYTVSHFSSVVILPKPYHSVRGPYPDIAACTLAAASPPGRRRRDDDGRSPSDGGKAAQLRRRRGVPCRPRRPPIVRQLSSSVAVADGRAGGGSPSDVRERDDLRWLLDLRTRICQRRAAALGAAPLAEYTMAPCSAAVHPRSAVGAHTRRCVAPATPTSTPARRGCGAPTLRLYVELGRAARIARRRPACARPAAPGRGGAARRGGGSQSMRGGRARACRISVTHDCSSRAGRRRHAPYGLSPFLLQVTPRRVPRSEHDHRPVSEATDARRPDRSAHPGARRDGKAESARRARSRRLARARAGRSRSPARRTRALRRAAAVHFLRHWRSWVGLPHGSAATTSASRMPWPAAHRTPLRLPRRASGPSSVLGVLPPVDEQPGDGHIRVIAGERIAGIETVKNAKKLQRLRLRSDSSSADGLPGPASLRRGTRKTEASRRSQARGCSSSRISLSPDVAAGRGRIGTASVTAGDEPRSRERLLTSIWSVANIVHST